MASISFQKVKAKATVAALMRHNDKEERLRHEHANEHINKEQTQQNRQAGTYKQCLRRFRERIDELDSTTNTNHRKDRVEAVAVEIPLPEGDWTPQQERQIAGAYFDFLADRYGKENICGFWLHVDEKHDYRDSISGETKHSRAHIHAIVVPVVDGRLCCKSFTAKQSMIEANRALDAIVRERFGCQFLTGETPKRQTVEELKAAEHNAELDKQITEQRQKLASGWQELDTLNRQLDQQKAEKAEAAETLKGISDDLAKAADLIAEGRNYLDWIDRAENDTQNFITQYIEADKEAQALCLKAVDESLESPQEEINSLLDDWEYGDD